MSTIIAPASHHGVASRDRRTPLLLDVLRSEWTKLRSVRSTFWTLLAAAAEATAEGILVPDEMEQGPEIEGGAESAAEVPATEEGADAGAHEHKDEGE